MENAADALKMAAAVLIFVLAISIIILAFGQVRETADTILDYRDRETVYIDGGDDYYYKSTESERQVGLETIIPSIYRAYYENYKIVFDGLTEPIYTVVENTNNGVKITEKDVIDLEGETLGDNNKKAEFLCGILYHDFKNISVPSTSTLSQKEYFGQKNFSITIELPNNSLYYQLTDLISKGKKIKEYLGVYYQNDNPKTPETMKYEKRVITYKIE